MKKLLLGLSTATAVSVPLIEVISCSYKVRSYNEKIAKQNEWNNYLDQSGFDSVFVKKAKDAIDWSSDSNIILKSDAFKDLSILKHFRLPQITLIKQDAFNDTSLPPGFTIPSSVKLIDHHAFHNAILPNNFKWSKLDENDNPVAGASIVSMTLREKWYLKWNNYLDKNNFDQSFINKAKTAIDWYSSTNIVLKRDAFKNTIIPSGFELPKITSIGSNAFDGAKLPENFIIPTSVVSIGLNAFYNVILATNFKWTKVDRNGNPLAGSSTILITSEEKWLKKWNDYLEQSDFNQSFINKAKTAIDWYSSTNIVLKRGAFKDLIIPNKFELPTITSIGSSAFESAILPSGFIIPSSVKTINSDAFKGVILPRNFVIPLSVTTIDTNSFEGATLPEGFAIPSSIVSLESNAFHNAILPPNFKWSNVDQNGNPIVGASLIVVTPREKWLKKWNDYLEQSDFNQSFINKAKTAIIWSSTSNIVLKSNAFKNFSIPNKFALPEITSIGANAFKGAILPRNFVIPSSVTSIDASAFEGATLPRNFTIPTSVVSLGFNAFYNVMLPSNFEWSKVGQNGDPIIGSSVVVIALNKKWLKKWNDYLDQSDFDQLFINKAKTAINWYSPTNIILKREAFKDLIIPNKFELPTITSIGPNAFEGATLPEGFIIPSSVLSIAPNAFNNAILPTNFKWSRTDQNGNPIVGASLIAITPREKWLKKWNDYLDQSDFDQSFINKAKTAINWYSPTNIILKRDAFKDLIIPNKFELPIITSIGEAAFEGATLPEGFIIPSSVIQIRSQAFKGVVFPQNFTIPSNVTSIGPNAFEGATLPEGFTIPTSVLSIAPNAFNDVMLPSNFKWSKVDQNGKPIASSSVIEITIKNETKNEKWNSYLDQSNFGQQFIEKAKMAIEWSSSSSVILVENAFNGLVIPHGLRLPTITSIGEAAFEGATLPEGFTIPTSVLSIAPNAFNNAILPANFKWSRTDQNGNPIAGASLIAITPREKWFEKWNDYLDQSDFDQSFIEQAKVAINWYSPTNIILKREAFKDLIIPNKFELPTITSIGEAAFEGATLPEGFIIPSSVIQIRSQAFKGVVFPQNFTIPSNVTSIGEAAFEGATLPEGFIIPSSVVSLETNAFHNTTLPLNFRWSSVDQVGNPIAGASIVEITPKEKWLKKWNNYLEQSHFSRLFVRKAKEAIQWYSPSSIVLKKAAFVNTTIPNNFALPSDLTLIGPNAFRGTIIPKGFIIPSKVRAIEASAFEGTLLPEDFTIPTTIMSLGLKAFDNAMLPSNFKWSKIDHNDNPVIGSFVVSINESNITPREQWNIYLDQSDFDKSFIAKAKIGIQWNGSLNVVLLENTFKDLIIPDGFKLPKITAIQESAFEGATLPEGFTIPTSVISIHQSAFYNAILPKGFKWSSLEENGTPSPGSIVILKVDDDRITSEEQWNDYLDKSGFDQQFIAKAKVAVQWYSSSNVILIKNAFKDLIIPNGFKLPEIISIGPNAFEGATLPARFVIPLSVISIGQDAFKNVVLPTNFKWSKVDQNEKPIVGSWVIKKTPIEKWAEYLDQSDFDPLLIEKFKHAIDWSSDLNITIVKNAFKDLIIPDGFKLPEVISTIASGAFEGANLPIGFTVPLSVKKIYPTAFLNVKLPDDSSKWSKIDSNGNPVAGSSVLEITDPKELWEFKFDKDKQTKSMFKFQIENMRYIHHIAGNAIDWSDPDNLAIKENGFDSGKNGFWNNYEIGFIKFPKHLKAIRKFAFKRVVFLEGFTIPSSVEFIDQDAFSGSFVKRGYKWTNGHHAGSTVVRI